MICGIKLSGESLTLRDLAVFAAADSSFAKAEKRLKKFCGISISENTIKVLCDQESVKIERWQQTDVGATLPFRNSYGELEFTTDGTMVNTLTDCKRGQSIYRHCTKSLLQEIDASLYKVLRRTGTCGD